MSRKSYKRILLVTDGMRTSEPVHETAFNLAKNDDAKVLIVDTLRPPSAAAKWFAPNASDVFEMVLADKQKRLEEIAERFRDGGIETETKVLLGKSSEVITREASKWDASLVIRYMKGARSKYKGSFGSTARSLMRYCPSPILLVGDKPVDVTPRVLACIDAEHDDNENRSIIRATRLVSRDPERTFAVYCWELYGEDMMKKQMNENAFDDSLEFGEQIYTKLQTEFLERHEVDCFNQGLRLRHGHPTKVIPNFCKQEKINVVVMCSASLNHPLKRYFGTTIESVLDDLPCSLLVVKPIGFVSPVSNSETASAKV